MLEHNALSHVVHTRVEISAALEDAEDIVHDGIAEMLLHPGEVELHRSVGAARVLARCDSDSVSLARSGVGALLLEILVGDTVTIAGITYLSAKRCGRCHEELPLG